MVSICKYRSPLGDLLLATDEEGLTGLWFVGQKHYANGLPDENIWQAVWKILLQIPYGQTVTYGEIAQQFAAEQGISTMSAQAVGGAVGHNKISIIIPCHRVIGADGSLTGYAGGIDKKIALLRLEGTDKYESLCSTNIG